MLQKGEGVTWPALELPPAPESAAPAEGSDPNAAPPLPHLPTDDDDEVEKEKEEEEEKKAEGNEEHKADDQAAAGSGSGGDEKKELEENKEGGGAEGSAPESSRSTTSTAESKQKEPKKKKPKEDYKFIHIPNLIKGKIESNNRSFLSSLPPGGGNLASAVKYFRAARLGAYCAFGVPFKGILYEEAIEKAGQRHGADIDCVCCLLLRCASFPFPEPPFGCSSSSPILACLLVCFLPTLQHRIFALLLPSLFPVACSLTVRVLLFFLYWNGFFRFFLPFLSVFCFLSSLLFVPFCLFVSLLVCLFFFFLAARLSFQLKKKLLLKKRSAVKKQRKKPDKRLQRKQLLLQRKRKKEANLRLLLVMESNNLQLL